MSYYVMVDRPAIKITSVRRIKQVNKPRRLHQTLDSAINEARRLANKTKSRTLVLQVVAIEMPDSEEIQQLEA